MTSQELRVDERTWFAHPHPSSSISCADQKYEMETAQFALMRRSPPISIMLLDNDVTGGSNFLSALRNLNELFTGLGADFG